TRRKGSEPRTRTLFEVSRRREVPIVTFVNKLDREGREPLELLDEIEQTLQIVATPASWPIGQGRTFLGAYDLRHDRLLLMEGRGRGSVREEGEVVHGLEDPLLED